MRAFATSSDFVAACAGARAALAAPSATLFAALKAPAGQPVFQSALDTRVGKRCLTRCEGLEKRRFIAQTGELSDQLAHLGSLRATTVPLTFFWRS